jgi:cytochrome c oxidase cbb3-type subunit 1
MIGVQTVLRDPIFVIFTVKFAISPTTMSQEATLPTRPNLSTPEDVIQRAAIDKTTRLPVLFFFTSAAAWLIVATLLGLLSSIKAFAPNFLDWEWTNFGRTQPAYINALVYGWAMQAGFGVMIWIMARLCRTELKNPITVVVAGHFWNLGVLVGVAGILGGYGTAAKWLEMPPVAWPILLTAYLLISVWMVIMFQARRKGEVFISQWYLLAACFTFPWMYLIANVIINTLKGTGVMGPAIASWYAGNLTFLWFAPVALGAAYYIIPKITGQAIYSYQLAKFAFWTLLALGGWTGMQELLGGPLPRWMPAISGGAQILLLVPVIAVAVNHFNTVRGNHNLVQYSATLRFTFFGAIGYTISCCVMALLTTASVGRFSQFSYAQDAAHFFAIYMFFSMVMFGAIYFIVPRVTGCEWISGSRIRFHFWFSAYGSVAIGVILLASGLYYGASLDEWNRDLQATITFGNGFRTGTAVAWFLVLIANLSFFSHLALMVMNRGRKAGAPTMMHDPEPEVDHAELVMTHEGSETA